MTVQKVVATCKAKRDELYKTLSETEMFADKSCYCKYTSKSRNNEQNKRNDALAHTVVSKILLKSQCSDLCLSDTVCCVVKVCKTKDSKNPHRWVEVRQCETVNRGSAITFKQQLENLYDERADQWGNEVAAILSGVIDLHAADAQYHASCYNPPSITEPLEEALMSVLSMMAEKATESWTLYVMYLAASGTVSRRQFVSNVTAYFGDELLVCTLHIEGCDSVVGFKASLGKVVKIVTISQSMGDDDELGET